MKKLNYLLILVVLLLAGCGSPIPEEPEEYKNPNLDEFNKYYQNKNVFEDTDLSEDGDTNFEPKAVTSDVHFHNYSNLEFAHYFITDKQVIRDDNDYSAFEVFSNYTQGSIDIAESIITGCASPGYYGDWSDQYIDESVKCNRDDSVGYAITIPGGTYQAYLPKDVTVTTCSVTNPIVCWGYRSDEEVRDYYSKNNECPSGYLFYMAGVSGPTDVCSEGFWSCRKKLCGGVNYCDIKEGVECFWNTFGGGVALGDPCDFFLGMGMAPADGSCDHKLRK